MDTTRNACTAALLGGCSATIGSMAKARSQFLCNHCGSVHPKWMGKCPDCGTWDSLQEYKTPTADPRAAARAAAGAAASSHAGDFATAAQALSLAEIDQADAPRTP